MGWSTRITQQRCSVMCHGLVERTIAGARRLGQSPTPINPSRLPSRLRTWRAPSPANQLPCHQPAPPHGAARCKSSFCHPVQSEWPSPGVAPGRCRQPCPARSHPRVIRENPLFPSQANHGGRWQRVRLSSKAGEARGLLGDGGRAGWIQACLRQCWVACDSGGGLRCTECWTW